MKHLGGAMLVTATGNILSRYSLEYRYPSVFSVPLLLGFSVLPVIFAIWVIGRYLAEEQDEFIRALAVRALLWGLAVTMTGDAVAGVLTQYYPTPLPLALLNADVLFLSSAAAFRLLQRSYQ